MRLKVCAGVVAIAAAMGSMPMANGAETVRTYRWELTDLLPAGGLGGALHATLVGPTGGTVVNTRFIAKFVSADAWNAAGVHLHGFAPIGDDGTPIDVTGADFGWSGVGYSEVVYDTDALNGPITFSLWSLHVNDFFDPYFGRFLELRIELEVENLVADETCTGDLNGDGEITPVDFQLFRFGPCPAEGPCPADLNGDGVVTIDDREMIIGWFGSVCPVQPAG